MQHTFRFPILKEDYLMLQKIALRLTILSVIFVIIAASCAPKPETVGGFQIPEIQKGKFNVAMVLIGPHDDGGWSQAHYEGLLYVGENVPDVNTAYIENVPEGADSEQIFRSLARKGFGWLRPDGVRRELESMNGSSAGRGRLRSVAGIIA